MSYDIFRNSGEKNFIAIPKADNLYVLRSIHGDKKSEKIIYQKPHQIGSGSFGKVNYYPTENIVSKVGYGKELTEDFVLEIAIYRLLTRLSCMPKFIGFSLPSTIQMEAGISTLDKAWKNFDYTQKKIVMFRIAKCLRQVSSQGIIHADLKPENIIVSGSGKVQIIDWGISEVDQSKGQKMYKNTEVQTLSYTAPEIVTTDNLLEQYSYKIDIFSLGIIFDEIYTGRTFDPVESPVSLKIQMMKKYTDMRGFDMDKLRDIVSGNPDGKNPESSREIIQHKLMTRKQDPLPELFANLIAGMLVLDPKHRITYEEIILHPFFHNIHRENVPLLPKFINNMPIIKNLPSYWEKQGFDLSEREKFFSRVTEILTEKTTEELSGYFGDILPDQFDIRKNSVICTTWQLVDLVMIKNVEKIEDIFTLILACIFISSCLYRLKYMSKYIFRLENNKINNYVENILFLLEGNTLIPSLYSYCISSGLFPKTEELLAFYLDKDIYTLSMPDFFNIKILRVNKRSKNVDMLDL